MKLQFSLATMLVCMTVLAVIAAVWMKVPVQDIKVSYVQNPFSLPARDIHKVQHTKNNKWEVTTRIKRSPNAAELASRLAWSWPLALAATFGVLWAVRRLKFRRRTERPAWATDMKLAAGILIGLAVLMVPEFILSFVNHASGQMDVAEYDRGVVCVVAFFAVGIVFWRYKPRNRIY